MKQTYTAALYIRLSREDGDGNVSDSVVNQQALLTAFAENDPDIISFRTFCDDGYTGTDFDRPAFRDMMRGIDSGKINCIIVKDLSRLGRNYIELGRLTEIVFPQKNVRFVALNDGIDSARAMHPSSSIIVPFKNLLNDEYSRDISTKIRSALDMKRKNGAFIGAFASYGYQKDPSAPSKLLIDPEAAEVVQRIFTLYLSGIGKHTIARMLNDEGVLSPVAYKQKHRPAYRPPNGGSTSLWSFSAVDRILKNRIYTGEMVQGKTKMLSHRIHIPVKQAENDWYVVADTHEAIISKAQFEAAAHADKATSRAGGNGETHVLAGLVKCGSCGRNLNRRKIHQSYGDYHYYFCPTYRQSKTACTKHTVRVETVEQAVLSALQKELSAAADFHALYETFRHRNIPISRKHNRQFVEKEIEKLKKLKQSVYEDWKSGDLTKEEYKEYKASYDDRLAKLEQRLSESIPQTEPQNPWLERLAALETPATLTRELVVTLIDEIVVFSETHIRIKFKFSDALAEARQKFSEAAN